MSWQLTALHGQCIQPGYATGRVRHVGMPARDADILVADALEPADIPELFACAAAVVERGGTTSHAAIAAQELGVPMLIGVAGATDELTAGSRVFVDTERNRILRADPTASCPFCPPARTVQVWAGARLHAIEDMLPVVRTHYLVLPNRHLTDPADLDGQDWAELGTAFAALRDRSDGATGPAAANLALNVGAAAGQTAAHLHWHLLIRTAGDDPDPRGGVRRLVAAPFRPYPTP